MNSQSKSDVYESIYTVVIPIDPEVILRNSNLESNVMTPYESIKKSYPNMESFELPCNENLSTPPPPGLSRNNNKQSDNSNGNGNINNEHGDGGNPRSCQTTAIVTNTVKRSNSLSSFDLSDYSNSPFNPLALMTSADYDTPVVSELSRDENSNNEELSLASTQFKLFVDERIKKVTSDSSSVKARLIIPAKYSRTNSNNGRWGLKIFGARADLVQAAKKEIMRSPSLYTLTDDEVDFETSLRTSKTIESILFEEGDKETRFIKEEESNLIKEKSEMISIDFPVLNSLSGLLLGPKYHVIKTALAEYNCTIDWEGTLALLPTTSSLNFRVSAKDPKSISSVIQILKDRSDNLDEIPLSITTVVIDSGKLDWIYSSGAIKKMEEVLWTVGGTLTHVSEAIYQVTCLSEALLNSCLKRLHIILSNHQSAHFTFRFRNDFRDFTTKCTGIFESLAQATDCVVSQKCLNNGCVEVEIGGGDKDLARALIRLDTIRSQIFESGSSDLKLIERRLRLHVPAEIREFICGKKDGKLNKIIKETRVNISLNLIGGNSMYVDLISEDLMGTTFSSNSLLHALRLIEGELPSELTFHVPEIHHKRMIGHGGKVIQRIMKKWGVYVKFMNNQETHQTQEFSDPLWSTRKRFGPLDNVVVRTPSKNASALKAIKEEIFEECSVSEITGQFDKESFKELKKIQNSSKSRVSVTLPSLHRKQLPSLLRNLGANQFIDSAVLIGNDVDILILEGEKVEITTAISNLATELKNEIEFKGDEEEIIVKSPRMNLKESGYCNTNYSSSSLSDASFKFFPSALFVVQSHQSHSASGSPILSNETFESFEETSVLPSPVSSIAMNHLSSMNSSPPLPVGHQKKLLTSKSEEINYALAETRRRSADIFARF